MTSVYTGQASRRAFLQRAATLSMAGAATPWALNLAALGEAAAATASDYRALVCVFLYGGNDYANTLVPYDAAQYAQYQAQRPSLAYARSALDATALNPLSAALNRNGVPCQFALAPELAPLLPLFNAGQLAAVLNLGPLVQPTTKAQYTARNVPLPPKLFSHNDQQSVWQALNPEGASSGWGGRLGDLFQAGNGNATFTCINVSGNAVFVSGQTAVQYQVGASGPVAFAGLKAPLFGSSAASTALRSLVTDARSHLLEAEYTRVTRRSIDAFDTLNTALTSGPALQTIFPSSNTLADQLKMVARTINAGSALAAKRQVFFVSLGGFDTHDGLLTSHPALLTKVAEALAAFQAAMVEIGAADKVTTFTASDFGRTLAGNNDGSDHGWGSMHFVLGGAVRGQRLYGTAPLIGNDGPDDVGQGRLLPTTAVDQFAATLGRWFGATDSELLGVLPNLANFNAALRNLGFV